MKAIFINTWENTYEDVEIVADSDIKRILEAATIDFLYADTSFINSKLLEHYDGDTTLFKWIDEDERFMLIVDGEGRIKNEPLLVLAGVEIYGNTIIIGYDFEKDDYKNCPIELDHVARLIEHW